MSSSSIGNDYEEFVEKVYKAILEAERREGRIGPVNIERKKIITSKSGAPSEIDIYWEYQIGGIVHKVAIECKNYSRTIEISRVRDFARKIEHISGLKGLMVTKKGFSSNAVVEASADHIDLLVIREQKDEDWEGRIKTVNVRLHSILPSSTLKILPTLDRAWALSNGFKKGDSIKTTVANNLIVIEDADAGLKHTVHALESNHFFEDKGFGTHTWKKSFNQGFISFDQTRLKMDSIEIEYHTPEPLRQEIHLDIEDYVLAVMEYINGQKEKFIVLKDGEKKPH